MENKEAFFALVRAGLWEKVNENDNLNENLFVGLDWGEVLRLAEEQSVVGLVTGGLQAAWAKIPLEQKLKFIGHCQLIKQRNVAMNETVASLVAELNAAGIKPVLVKGQGVAQCYKQPFLRSCGDIDFVFDDDDYSKAKLLLAEKATSIEDENAYNQHVALTIDGRCVELHGSLWCGLWKNVDKTLDDVQNCIFHNGKTRVWLNEHETILLPRADEEIVYVFAHILQHFFKEGVGLKQICDWCRLLWTYSSIIDIKLLECRLNEMGTMSEWKAFAALSVNYLGMPADYMPFYSPDIKWSIKSKRLLSIILATGSFGHNKDYSYYQKHNRLTKKAISLWRHTKDCCKYSTIFPMDSLKIYKRVIKEGVKGF